MMYKCIVGRCDSHCWWQCIPRCRSSERSLCET